MEKQVLDFLNELIDSYNTWAQYVEGDKLHADSHAAALEQEYDQGATDALAYTIERLAEIIGAPINYATTHKKIADRQGREWLDVDITINAIKKVIALKSGGISASAKP